MAKNTHLEHLEDDIFNQGYAGATNAVNFLKSLRDMLSDSSGGSSVKVTTKWDGAPAIICGRNPQTGKFFVGTKSVFNKVDPKIVYSSNDADKYYAGSTVGDILKKCLVYLSKLPIEGVLQGDLLYQSTPSVISQDQKPHYRFKPNTITYTIPKYSALGSKVGGSKLGIVFHTEYKGDTISTMSAGFGCNVSGLQGVKEVAVFSSEFQNINGMANLSQTEKNALNAVIVRSERDLRRGQSFLNDVQSGKGPFSIPALFKVYFNQVVRGGVVPTSEGMAKGFGAFVKSKYDSEIVKKKTPKARNDWRSRRRVDLKYLNSNKTQMLSAFRGFKSLMDAKVQIINKLVKIKSVGTFLEDENGMRATSPEGFVAIKDGAALKLVDRLEFSRANFTVAKDWG